MQGKSSWLWRYNLLLLRLLGEISLSLVCSHSSWGSALVLASPLCVGCPQASVPCPDRRGFMQRLIRGLWLTQGWRKEGYGSHNWNVGQACRQQRLAWCCNSLRCAMCSPGEVFPGSGDPRSGGLHRLPGGWCGEWPVLAHRILGGNSSSLSISYLSLVSMLIAMAHAHLWSSFRQCSESPLLVHQETMVSCFLGSRLFPRLPPS